MGVRVVGFAVVVLLVSLVPVAPVGSALPTPGLFCDASEVVTARLFPEAMESNDFVSYEEALCGLDRLQAMHPEWIRRDVVGHSVGWTTLTGQRDTFEVFVVRVSDYAAPVPVEQKQRIVFQLSIHGNEKGGREGGLRVIEDLVRGDLGIARDHPDLRAMLRDWELLFVFPNPDGWTHEEAKYRHNDACYVSVTCTAADGKAGAPGLETQNFVRVNGNGVDVNREWPTIGWVRARYTPMSEPEAVGLVDYLKRETNVRYASDLHGMLNPADGKAPAVDCGTALAFDPTGFDPTCFANSVEGASGHYVLTMLPAGRQDPREMQLTTSLAERVKETLNNDPYFAEWRAWPGIEQGVWGGEFNDWGTVWDTLGYTDSGFTSDFYAQDTGLNAPGVDFEFSYNHITLDNYYPGVAQRMNAYHVQATRDIVIAFMRHAAEEHPFTLDAQGTRTAWLRTPVTLTNDPATRALEGWAAENPADDAYDAAHRAYRASANDYFDDLRAHLRGGTLEGIERVDAATLASYDNLVLAGSALRLVENDTRAKADLRAWVENGGTLLLTDEALRLLSDLGLAQADAVEVNFTYAGHTNFVDKTHRLVEGVRGLARQTYEPVPLGYNLSARNAPVWHVKKDGLAQGVEIVGVAGQGQGGTVNPEWVNLGDAKLGAGRVVFLGALLPDPVDADAAYYGVDSYATTYTGNLLVANTLGWATTDAEPVDAASAPDEKAGVPGPGALLVVGALAAAGLTRRIRRA